MPVRPALQINKRVQSNDIALIMLYAIKEHTY